MPDQRLIIWVGGHPFLGPTEEERTPTRTELVEFVWRNYNRAIGPETKVLFSRGLTVEHPLAVPQNSKEA